MSKQAIIYWLRAFAVDLIFFGSLTLWVHYGFDGAENVFRFMAWLLIVLRLVVALGYNKGKPPKIEQRPAGFVTYHFATEVLTVFALVWFGMLWCAGFYVFAAFVYEGALSHIHRLNGGAA